MACLLKLVRLNDFAADIDELDLLSGGFGLAADGYMPVAAPYGAQYVDEPLTLKITGTSKDDLASKIHSLDEKIKQVQWWMENQGVERYQVWIRSQLDNESLPRQAMLADIRPPDKVRIYNPVEINSNYIGEYTLGITRTAYWEDPYPYPTTTDVNGLNIIGGAATLSETINGDVPARLARLTVIGNNDPITGFAEVFTDFWAGWKTSRFGVVANFVPVWPLDKGAPVDTDTSEVADGTAYDGTKVTTSFATVSSLILRDKVILTNVVPVNIADQRGTYMVLLRAKMSDTSVARVQMAYGLSSNSGIQSPIVRSRQVISGTAWSLYELGTAKIPPSRIPLSYSFQNFAFGIYAERISGSGSLDMDCLVLIPIDDSGIKMSSSGNVSSSGSQRSEVFTSANGDLYATAQYNSGQVLYFVVPKPQGNVPWSLPANSDAPRLVIAANDATAGSILTNTLNITYAYIPRWRVLRGNET